MVVWGPRVSLTFLTGVDFIHVIFGHIYAPPLRKVLLAGVEQVAFVCDNSRAVQYLSNISYHTGVNMV